MAVRRVDNASYIQKENPPDPATIPRDEPFRQEAPQFRDPFTNRNENFDNEILSGIESRIQNGPYTLSMALESIKTAMINYIVPRHPPTESEMYMKSKRMCYFASAMAYFIAIQSNITPDYPPWITGALIAVFVFHYLHSAIPKPTLNNRVIV